MESDEILTTDEVAALLKIHPKTVYKFLKANELQGHRFGRIWRFKKSDGNEAAWTVKGCSPQWKRASGDRSSSEPGVAVLRLLD